MHSISVAALAAAFGTLCLGVCAQTQAAPVTFQGSTSASFNGAPAAASATLDGLTFTNSTFNATTSNDFVAFGNETGSGGTNFNNFGSLTLTGAVADYTGDTFTLLINFTAPTGINGSPVATFTANIVGSVSAPNTGGAFINLDNTPQVFTFNGGGLVGSFTLAVNDVALTAGSSDVPITGQITSNAVPEPSTALLGGLGALALASRRRRAAK